MNGKGNNVPWLFDAANWAIGPAGAFPALIGAHLFYTFAALAIAAIVAIPVGLYIGHTNRFAFLAINLGNAGRALPTFGLISLLVIILGLGETPVMVALVVLAIPPILTSTFAGLQAVDRATVDAARGVGMRSTQVLFRVEVPIALPLIVGGIRSAALQVIATATVAAYVGLSGLGQPLIYGLSLNQYDRVIAGGVLVAALAIVIDLAFEAIQKYLVSPGVTGRAIRRSTKQKKQSIPNEASVRDLVPATKTER
ncbi:ABC transporter permease [Arthrobacter sp. NPDC080031]|uniref:ABC transporter permease n=1 Tax=Arthrobacter sp. NPDC080031 TaxID=3155918 RepID=UPI00344B1CAF